MSTGKENMEVVRDWIEHKVTTLFEGDRETLKRMWTKTPGHDLKKFLNGPVQLLTITNTKSEFLIRAGKAKEDSEFPTLTLLKHEPKSLEMFVTHMRKTEVWDSVGDLIDWNLRPGNALKQMDASFKYLFVPLFEGGHPSSGGGSGEMDSKKSDGSSYEFTNQVQKFSSQLSQVVQHVTEKVDIEVPDVEFDRMDEKGMFLFLAREDFCTAPSFPIPHASEVDTAMTHGTYACGLYLEGAGWGYKNQCLKPQDPKSLVTELPVMQIIPIEARKLKLKNTFRTPVYVTQSRRNAMGVGLVFEANLRSSIHPSLWTLQGVALVLNIDT